MRSIMVLEAGMHSSEDSPTEQEEKGASSLSLLFEAHV